MKEAQLNLVQLAQLPKTLEELADEVGRLLGSNLLERRRINESGENRDTSLNVTVK